MSGGLDNGAAERAIEDVQGGIAVEASLKVELVEHGHIVEYLKVR